MTRIPVAHTIHCVADVAPINNQDVHALDSLPNLTAAQQEMVALPTGQNHSLFVRGPAGAGKTTALQQRLIALLAGHIPSTSILTLVAEPESADSFRRAVAAAGLESYSDLSLTTFAGLARELLALFWPLVAREAGFGQPEQPPTFVAYDLAQIIMRQVIAPLQDKGAFQGLRLRPQQILSQLLDNLNRAALNGLDLDEMETRLVDSQEDPTQAKLLQEAAGAAKSFRQHCLAHNLVDLSLLITTFCRHLSPHPHLRAYLHGRFRHLLVDNVDELPPAGVQFVAQLLPACDSAVLAYDEPGGYKRYLAADPEYAASLAQHCQRELDISDRTHRNPGLDALANRVQSKLDGPPRLDHREASEAILEIIRPRYRREMVQQTVAYIAHTLIPAAGEALPAVAVLAPYLDGALVYALTQELNAAGLSSSVLRRRGSPRDEPLVRSWLTLALLAHPEWGLTPSSYDVAESLTTSLADLDRPRGVLATRHLYDTALGRLRPVESLPEAAIPRIGRPAVERLGEIQHWLDAWPGTEPLDRFLATLFHDLLSQPRFQPKPNVRAAAVCDWLTRAARRFRQAAPALNLDSLSEQGRAFVEAVYDGIVTGEALPRPTPGAAPQVVVASVYAYLLSAGQVPYQVWLETGASGWWEIPHQPLSNAFVLTPTWNPAAQWTAADSIGIRNQLLARLVRGLCQRCGRGVVLATSDLDRRGERQNGPLWRALEALLLPRLEPSPAPMGS